MFPNLIQLVGPWFLLAIVLEAFAVFVEQAGAARSPEDDKPRHRAEALVAFLLSLATPSLLIAHGFFTTQADQTLSVIAVGLPIAAVLIGALLGAMLGAVVKGAAPLMRKLALPLDIMAFGVTIYATLATIQVLIQAAQNGGVVYVAP